MEHVKDFESFYTINIRPYAEEMNRIRVSFKNWKLFTFVTGSLCLLSFILFHLQRFPSGALMAVGFLIMCIIGIYHCTLYQDRYLDDFKEKIIRRIITYIHPGSVYKPMGFVSKKEYKASGLFRRKFTHFDGNDYWESTYNGVTFHCSEIESSYSDPTGSELIFKGLFFTVKLPVSFTGGTYVWAKDNVQLPASIADEHYRLYALPGIEKFKTSNLLFNKAYAVYTTNAYEAQRLLAGEMPGHMLLLKERLKKDIVFSFVGGRCYVAIPFAEDLLEPSPNGVSDKEAIRNYFYTILLVFNIIKKLELTSLT